MTDSPYFHSDQGDDDWVIWHSQHKLPSFHFLFYLLNHRHVLTRTYQLHSRIMVIVIV